MDGLHTMYACLCAAAEILPASTWDWVPTLSGGSFAWYIERLAEAVQQLQAKHQQQISLVRRAAFVASSKETKCRTQWL
jgi:hypothetical protein